MRYRELFHCNKQATDEDEGLNAALKYTIVSGNDNGDFSINPNSGALSAVKSLDYERNSLYIIIVSVSDLNGDKGGYEDLAAVQINIKVFVVYCNKITLLGALLYFGIKC